MRLTQFVLQFMRYVINWPAYLVNAYVPVTYILWGGGHIRVAPADRCSFNDVFVCRHYDANLPWSEIKTIIDVGANIGSFTVFAATHAPSASIVAIEPEPCNFRLLKRNARIGNVRCIQAAVSGTEGKAILHIGRSAGEHSLYGTGGETIEVQTITLHDQIQNGCDLLKIDCEGAEYAILRSLSPAELRTIRFFLIELHKISGEDETAIIDLFNNLGFRVTRQSKHVILCTNSPMQL